MAANIAIENMPAVVHEVYAFLLDETGVEPVVERGGYGKILLTHPGERTKMTIQFRLSGKKWRWEKSRLFIDGKQVPTVLWDQYVSVFKDPDEGLRNHVPRGARKAVLPETEPISEQYLPPAAADLLKQARKDSTKDALTVEAGITSTGEQYLVTIRDEDSGKSITLTFGTGSTGTWQIVDVVIVNPLGYDITDFVGEDLNEYFADLIGAQSRKAQVPVIPSGGPQDAAAVNSTMVRKATVFRI